MKIGIVAESLNLPLRTVLTQAAQWGVSGLQLNATGDVAPERLTETGRREFRHRLRSYSLEVSALYCPLRSGFDVPERLTERIDRLKEAMTLSYDLGAKIVVVQAGGVPTDVNSPAGKLMMESLTALGQYGDRIGAILALESGLDSGEKLNEFLNRFDSGSIAVNYDPANMLIHGYDPVGNLLPLKGKIVHTHARDARPSAVSRAASEVALGAGHIDWMLYTATLEAMEYRGYLAVERETSENRLADVEAGVKFLRRFIPPTQS